jgi:hypothetical protein
LSAYRQATLLASALFAAAAVVVMVWPESSHMVNLGVFVGVNIEAAEQRNKLLRIVDVPAAPNVAFSGSQPLSAPEPARFHRPDS